MKKIYIVLIICLLVIGGVYFYKTSSGKNTFVTIQDTRYFNMQFQYPKGYKKVSPFMGVFQAESPDFHSSNIYGGTIMDQGARIELIAYDIFTGNPPISEGDWIKGKISSAFSSEVVSESSIDGTPVVIVEQYPTQTEPPYNYNKSVHFFNPKERKEIVLSLAVMLKNKTKENFDIYRMAFDKMVSTIKLNQ